METKHLEQLMLFPMMDEKSTSSSAEVLAKTHLALEKEKGLSKAKNQVSHSHIPDWLTNWRPIEDFDGLSGKMSRTASASTEDETSQHFFQVLPDGRLSRPKTDGKTSELCLPPQRGISGFVGECWTCSMPEWTGFPKRYRKDEGVSSLSGTLVHGSVPLKYYLSSVACSGISHRSEKRNKPLPERLEQALAEMTEFMLPMEAWLAKVSNPETCPDAPRYKATGNSFGVNCIRWIGLGIQAVEDSMAQQQTK